MKNLNIIAFLCLSIFVISCQREVDIDLNSSDKKLIIEGNVSNEDTSVVVRLTKSGGYGKNTSYEVINNATVQLTTNGTTYNIPYTSDGYYKFSGITPVTNQKFEVSIFYDDNTYKASTIFPKKVKTQLIGGLSDGIYGYLQNFQLEFEAGNSFVRIKSNANTETNPGSFYNLNEFINMNAGETFEANQYVSKNSNDSPYFLPGDSITTKTFSIDSTTYAYFLEYQEATEGDILFSRNPYNPTNNFNEQDVYGYFGSYQVTSIKSYIP